MKTICLYTQSSRLSQRWEELLAKTYQVKHFTKFDDLKSALGDNTYVVFHEDSDTNVVMSELDALHEINEKKNSLVLRNLPSIEEGEAFLSHDIGGYGNANMSDDVFLQAVEVVSSGNIWLYPELMADVVSKIDTLNKKSSMSEALETLTPREKEVAQLVAKGESNKLIADDLTISQNTVKLHIASIFEKLEVKSRVALALRVNGS